MASFKYLTPSLVQYLANNTIAADLISFYIPLWKTLIVVLKYKHVCDIGQRDQANTTTITESESMKKSTGYFSFLYKSNTQRPTVADEYKKAITKKSNNNNNNTDGPILTKKSSQKHTKSHVSQTEFNINEINATSKEAAELLKYWIVYGIITAFIHIATLLPILGRIFYNANPINAKKAAASVSKKWSTKKISVLEKIKIPTSVLEEIKLFFFAWLRLLPTSLTSLSFNNNNSNSSSNNSSTTTTNTITNTTGSVKSRIKAMEKQSTTASSRRRSSKTTKTYNSFSNQPLDIMYEKLSPIVTSFMSTSTNAIHVSSNSSSRNNNNNTTTTNTTTSNPLDSFKAKVILFSQTMLNAMVWTKIISESTKELIENTFSQCRQLLPAAVTLTMPSYFTSYGVVYVQLIVPCANSTNAYDEFHCQYNNDKNITNHEVSIIDKDGFMNEKWISISLQIIQYLQYWTIQAILSSILISFAPVLAWIPLSTHLIWLLWAYVQLESKTKKLYNIMEFDLLAFGILKTDTSLFVSCEGGRGKKMDHGSGIDSGSDSAIKDTVTMQFLNSIMEKVPSNLSSSAGNGNGNTCDDKKDGKCVNDLTIEKKLSKSVSSDNNISSDPSGYSKGTSNRSTQKISKGKDIIKKVAVVDQNETTDDNDYEYVCITQKAKDSK